MLAFVPVTFDLYRPLKPRLRWAMQSLVGFADQDGRCFPSVRTFAQHAGISKSAGQRYLAELVETGYVARKRRPGGVYIYRIDRRFLPKWAPRKLSQARDRKSGAEPAPSAEQRTTGVPGGGTEEKPNKKNQGWARKRARFAEPGLGYGELPDESAKWRSRLRSWRQSRFWLPLWGPKPTEPGCMAPPALLQAAI
jgi:DNA-binding transcriptional MocR family regulator